MHSSTPYITCHICFKAAAERLDRDTAQYEDCPGPLVEAAKQIASMWKKMGELIMCDLIDIFI